MSPISWLELTKIDRNESTGVDGVSGLTIMKRNGRDVKRKFPIAEHADRKF